LSGWIREHLEHNEINIWLLLAHPQEDIDWTGTITDRWSHTQYWKNIKIQP